MLTTSLLMLSWAVGGLNATPVEGYAYSMSMTGTSGVSTCLVRDMNDMVLGYDVSLSYDLTYLTNDRSVVPQNLSDCVFIVNSIRVNVVNYSLLSDYRENFGQTFYFNHLCNSFGEFVNHYVQCGFDTQNDLFSIGIFDLDFGSSVPRYDNAYSLQGQIDFTLERNLDFDENSFLTAIQNGYAVRTNTAYEEGRTAGYIAGLAEGQQQDETIASIFSGILEIGLVPINVFLAMFNFDILGINITEFVTALLTAMLVVYVVRIFIGGGDSNA